MEKNATEEEGVEESLNYEQLKESHKILKKDLNKIISAVIKNAPSGVLIDLLQKRKIIERDWDKDDEKYNLRGKK